MKCNVLCQFNCIKYEAGHKTVSMTWTYIYQAADTSVYRHQGCLDVAKAGVHWPQLYLQHIKQSFLEVLACLRLSSSSPARSGSAGSHSKSLSFSPPGKETVCYWCQIFFFLITIGISLDCDLKVTFSHYWLFSHTEINLLHVIYFTYHCSPIERLIFINNYTVIAMARGNYSKSF